MSEALFKTAKSPGKALQYPTGVYTTCVDDSVVEETIPHLPEIIGDMVRVPRFTGDRPGEVGSLRPCDLDRSTEVWFYRPCQHKTEHHDKDRVIAIGPQSQQVLPPYLVRDSESCCPETPSVGSIHDRQLLPSDSPCVREFGD